VSRSTGSDKDTHFNRDAHARATRDILDTDILLALAAALEDAKAVVRPGGLLAATGTIL
jgi:hypothetical protein